jgi:DNA mismatch endonuclease (patch repair protein)
MDRIDAERRSRNMAAIKRKNTSVEWKLRRALWASGLRGYRVDSSRVTGRPDVAFGPSRVAVFVDGCFWHKCPECYREPTTNVGYWRAKTERNAARDKAVDQGLADDGWTVLRLWEHEVESDLQACVDRIAAAVGSRR